MLSRESLLAALKAGERFPAEQLALEPDVMACYWEWWWSQARYDRLTRPHVVHDHDPAVAVATQSKPLIDTVTYAAFASAYLLNARRAGYLLHGALLDRAAYRDCLVRHVLRHGERDANPVVVFVGGGYGSGKTTILDFLVKHGALPIQRGQVMGVDYFKSYLPEYCFLQRLGEGRASSVVQEEARQMSDDLFGRLVRERLSFGWDSSMSNPAPTLEKLRLARAVGYRIVFLAVFTPLEVAIRQAMERARKSRRFAHPDRLPESHRGFRACWRDYLPLADEAWVFANEGTPPGAPKRRDPCLIARMVEPNKELVILDGTTFSSMV
jgi:predicted ABC-type ATPase